LTTTQTILDAENKEKQRVNYIHFTTDSANVDIGI